MTARMLVLSDRACDHVGGLSPVEQDMVEIGVEHGAVPGEVTARTLWIEARAFLNACDAQIANAMHRPLPTRVDTGMLVMRHTGRHDG